MANTAKNPRPKQAEKSENTRQAIMEATIQCFLTDGYKYTTVMKIAETAGVSRGAMMHHFDSRIAIIKAAVAHLVERRLQEFQQLMSRAPNAGSDLESVNEESLRFTINSLWTFFHLPTYTAYQELLVAARTDADLAAMIGPAQRELDKRISQAIRELFPVWKEYGQAQEVLTDLYFYTLQGMALNQSLKKDQKRVKNLLNLLIEQALVEMRKVTR